jgi:hypothetical protein
MPVDVSKNRLMVEVHYYDPYDFTINSNSAIIEWGNAAPDASKTETWANEAYADGQFQKMETKFVNNNVAVILGEYGAMARLNLGSADLNAIHSTYRLYYMKYITHSIVGHGLVPFYWDSGYTGNNASGIFNRSTGAHVYPEIIKAITDTSYKSPTTSKVIGIGMLKLYPNPADSYIKLEITNQHINGSQLYNSFGQVVQILNIKNGLNMCDISSLRPGFYFVKIATSDGLMTEKILKD